MAGTRRIKPEIEAAIVSEYAAGTSAGQLAAKYGIHRRTVTTVVRRNGGQVLDQRVAGGRPPIDPMAYVGRVVALRNLGLSQTEIGKQVGICQTQISRVLRQVGMPTRDPLKRERHGSWKGGVVRVGAYLAENVGPEFQWPGMIPRHGYLLQHRKVMALTLGRPLDQHETVHHINGDGHDNRPENLQLHSGKHGKGVCHRCRHCGSTDIETTET